MARRTKEEAQETRKQLLDAAEDVFHRDGYARTTLEAVASATNLTRGAVYWHFRNKADLFNAMCERVRLPMEALIEADASGRTNDPLGHIRNACIFFLKQVTQDAHCRKVFDILFHKCEFVDPEDPVFVRQREAFLRGRERLTKLLADAVDKGHLAPDLDIRLAAILFQASIEGILKSWLFSPECFNLQSNVERLVDACIDTVRHAPALRNMK